MKENTNKWHFIMSSNDSSGIKIGSSLIKREIPGVKIDTKLTFVDHIKGLCRKANSKLGTLGRVTPCMGLAKKKLLMNSFFVAQFNCLPLIWMFHSRSNNNKITHLRERCLRLICSDKSPHLMKNYWKGMDQYLFVTKLFKLVKLGCLKIKMKLTWQ